MRGLPRRACKRSSCGPMGKAAACSELPSQGARSELKIAGLSRASVARRALEMRASAVGARCLAPRASRLAEAPTDQAGYSSVGRASDCRDCRYQMVPGSIPGGRTLCFLGGGVSAILHLQRASLGGPTWRAARPVKLLLLSGYVNGPMCRGLRSSPARHTGSAPASVASRALASGASCKARRLGGAPAASW